MAKNLNVKVMTKEELEFLKEKIETLISTKGIEVVHPEAIEIFKKAGAEVSEDGIVKFPRNMIAEAIKNAPREFTLASIDSKHDLKFPHPEGSFYTRTNTGAPFYLTADGEYHHIRPEEVAEQTRLANALEHIDFWSLPSTNPQDLPTETIDIHTLNIVFRNSTKHGWVQPYEAPNIKYLIEMAAAVVGGKEELRKRPIISAICCGVPRLTYKYMDMNIIYECAMAGVPLQCCSLPAAGANVPITPAGVAMMASAEVLGMIIMANIIAPGTPCVAVPLLFEMDMATTNTTQSAISTTLGRMIAMQLFEEGYGIPAHTYATGTDAIIPDGQAGFEQATLSEMVALAGGSILGGAGQIETAKTVSPLQLIIDNDVFGMVKDLKRGVDINEETLAWDDLQNLTPHDSFIDKDHTYDHFRDFYRAKTFNRDAKASWEMSGSKTLLEKAKEVYETIKENYELVVLPEEVLKKLDEIVERADREIGKTTLNIK